MNINILKMKYLKIFSLLLIFSILVVGCKKNKEQTFEEQLEDITLKYVQSELYISNVDSVRILKIDTVTQYGYVQINIEILEQMEIGEYYEIQNAIQDGDTVAEKQHELNMKQIGDALEQWRELEKNLSQNDETLYRYLITANYYSPVGMDQFYYLLTPELEYFVLDPYADDLIQ